MMKVYVIFFFDCICTKLFWYDFRIFFEEISGIDVTLEEKNVLFYYDKPLENTFYFVINLFIILAKYHIHKCRWSKSTPNFLQFKFELRQYLKVMECVRNSKAKKTIDCCKALKRYPF